MSKQKKQQIEETVDAVETAVETTVETLEEQAVEKPEKTVKEVKATTAKTEKKSGGTAVALLALLVALGIGGAGYFFGSQKLGEVESKIAALKNIASQPSEVQTAIEIPTFEAEKAQISELLSLNQKATERIARLEQDQQNYISQISGYTAQINNLQLEVQKLSSAGNDNSAWLLSDANSLLKNALHKLVLDSDVDTAKKLLEDADSVLTKVSDPYITTVRQAIKSDLEALKNVNEVDQNGLMLALTNLANRLDDLPLLENSETSEEGLASGEVSDSIEDWQQNLEKSANSFLNKFIRVSNRSKTDEKAFVAPNQEVYLRENIRLRLQIATLAISRQQNELYKQSLSTVSSWIRSYFDSENENVKGFLKSLEELREHSVYVDAPRSLQSLAMLGQMLNRAPVAVAKPEIKTEQVDQSTPTEQPKAAE